MWLLRADTARLQYFNIAPPKYAILSHVWGDHEQPFQDTQELALIHENPREHVPDKIKKCCMCAEMHGFKLLWIDTCCIDKTSSAELSEAINSMYQWYAAATVCYVYLEDVWGWPADISLPEVAVEVTPSLNILGSPVFQRLCSSRWFTRGWTLQELIAAKKARFVTRDWHLLGTKEELAALLTLVTGVNADVLTFSKSVTSIPVAERMSWASRRQTTRLEDEAYSLMGIFGVSMPTIYGEGRRAFRRLQEEVMKSCADHSLFVWGPTVSFPARFLRNAPKPRAAPNQSLFADSPADFDEAFRIAPMPIDVFWDALRQQLLQTHTTVSESLRTAMQRMPEFTVTSYGIRAHLPIIEGHTISVAILACHARREPPLGLVLRRQTPNSPIYEVGASLTIAGETLVPESEFKYDSTRLAALLGSDTQWCYARCIRFDAADPLTQRLLGLTDNPVMYEWKDIYIQQQY
ncbi:heterokaryon incompatibility protein-domain-containing protein [Daedaleopsis nitida]|nr:heterokaryon incompatibility protein-domain-containing protein [Daedaleopsis nitida]